MRTSHLCSAIVLFCAGGCSSESPSTLGAPALPAGDAGFVGDAPSGATDGGSPPVDGGTAQDASTPPTTDPTPKWVSSLPLWQWYEIPNTKVSSVAPTPKSPGSTGPSSKIDAWVGATLKRQGSVYMLGAAGGHADYAGNEVDALPLYTETPTWVQLRAPSPTDQMITDSQFYLDGTPAATHTYQSTQFINARNRMFVITCAGMSFSSLPMPPADWPYTGTLKYSFSFDMGTNQWDPPTYVAPFPGAGEYAASLTVKHPVTDDIYYSRSYGDGWYRWTQATNTWTKLSNTTRAPWYAGAAIDPTRDRMLIAGGYDPSPAEVRGFDGASVAVSFSGPAAAELANAPPYTGVIYDEASDRFLVVMNSGSNLRVLRVNPETWEVDAPPMTGTTPAARTNGVQNAVQYVPELKGFVIANAYDGNVLFVRTAP